MSFVIEAIYGLFRIIHIFPPVRELFLFCTIFEILSFSSISWKFCNSFWQFLIYTPFGRFSSLLNFRKVSIFLEFVKCAWGNKSTKLFMRELYICANPTCSLNKIVVLAATQGFRHTKCRPTAACADLVQIGIFGFPHEHVGFQTGPRGTRSRLRLQNESKKYSNLLISSCFALFCFTFISTSRWSSTSSQICLTPRHSFW